MSENYLRGMLAQQPQNSLAQFGGGMLSPATANPNMLAQAMRAREQTRNMLVGPTTGTETAQYAGMVPGLGLLGVGGDVSQYIQQPETRNWLNYALTAAGALPFLGAMAKMAGPLPKGMLRGQTGAIAYHGSPHKFDEFDASKIGTGEGAQVYGHGIYLAQNPSVAKDYANKLSQGNAAIAGVSLDSLSPEAKKIVEYNMFNNDMYRVQRFAEQGNPVYKEAWDFLSKNAKPQSNLYKADIPDEWLPKMLDWDKPLSQQPANVRDAINRVARDAEPYGLSKITDDMRPSEMASLLRSPEATRKLQELGIPGIRYLDQGSRGAGQGTSNYVVFPGMEKQVKILERK